MTILRKLVIDKIAANLREFGYPDVTGLEVARQLILPEDARNIVGMFAADMLRENGIESWSVDYDV
jgi:hypothetical protein